MKQYGHDFFDIWQHLPLQVTCMIILSRLCQELATMPTQNMRFVKCKTSMILCFSQLKTQFLPAQASQILNGIKS